MRIKGYKRYIAIALITAFAVTFLLPKQSYERVAFAKSLKNVQEGKSKIEYENPETKTKLGSFSEKLLTIVEKMNSSIEKGDVAELRRASGEAVKAFREMRREALSEVEENGNALGKLNSYKARERNEKFKEELDAKLAAMETMFLKLEELSNLSKDLKGAELENLKAKAEELTALLASEQPQQPTGSLPHNNVSVQPPSPPTGAGITPAYVSQPGDTAAAVLSSTPTQEDKEQIPETALHDNIKAKADELVTALKIFEFVQNSIDFEPYYGSRKGAIGTLNQMAGNDYDQASLLISMLRYKGIPSRYVRGTIDLPIERVMNWTGGETPEAALKILGGLGIPLTSIASGGKISAVRLEHIWVEAYVPYDNYRGVGQATGQSIWVPLDPSFKKYEKIQGINIEEATGFTKAQIIETFKTTGERSADGTTITRVDIGQASTMANTMSQKVEAYMKEKGLDKASLREVIGGRKIAAESLGLLPTTLPYKVITVSAEFNKISNECSDSIGFIIRGNDSFNLNFSGDADFNVSYKAVDLYGKRITLSWVPASQEDVDIINTYGGIYNTPAYLIKLKPQLKLDGQVAAEGKPVGLGYRQQFTIVMGNAGGQSENVTNPVTVGGYYNVGLDYGKIDSSELRSIQNRLLEVKDRATERDIYTDEVMGDILNAAAKSYFAQLDAFNEIIGEATKVRAVRLISEAMTGYNPNVKYMFMTPVELTGGAFFIDVDHDVVGATSYEDKKENTIAYMLNAGVIGSAMEHGIFEQMLQTPSVSTIKVLTEASKRGIPIYNIDKSNADKINELTVSQSVKTDIQNAVNSGKTVVIPKQEINYYDWHGAGYIIMDPGTGSAAYMISGGLAGGSAAVDIGISLMGLATLIMTVIDTVEIAFALLAATNPIMIGVFWAVFALSCWSVSMTMNDIIGYWETGDYQYANSLMRDLILNLATFGAFKILEAVLPGVIKLFKNILNQMDGIASLASRYGDEVAEIVARYGDDGLEVINKYTDDAARIINTYKDDGLIAIYYYGDELMGMVSRYGDDVAGKVIKYGDNAIGFINKFADDGLRLAATYGDEVIENFIKYGDNAVEATFKYGSEAMETIAKYGDDGIRAMMKDIDPALINRLDGLGIKPGDFDRLGILSRETAEKVAESIEMGNSLKTISSLDDALTAIGRVSFSGLDDSIIKIMLKNIDNGVMSVADKVTAKAALFNKALAEGVKSDALVVARASNVDELGNIKWPTNPPDGFTIPNPPSKTLEVGTVIDRYGNPYGSFTSPAGTPFAERALPYIDNPGAYHKYRVIKPIEGVKYGDIAPAFGQPGGGTQFKLPDIVDNLLGEYLEEIF